MVNSVIRFALKQKVFFNLLFLLFTLAGIFALTSLPTERYPDINFGEVNITTYFPGASPTEVESLVTRKIEETLEQVESIEWITATSYPERSYLRIKFVDDSDYEHLFNEVRLKVLNMLNELPDEIDPPKMEHIIVSEIMPVVSINIGGNHSNRALALIAKQIKTSLQTIPNVKEVRIEGEYVREFHINLDPEQLRLLGISFDQVSNALQNANVSVAAGSFKNSSGDFLIKVDEKFNNREQVAQTIIRRDGDGGFIRLEDLITHIGNSYRDPITITSVNGENVVSLKIIKSSSGDALKIKDRVEQIIKKHKHLFEKENVQVTLTHDSTLKINDGLSTLGQNMLFGIILVAIVVWYFMGTRNALLITVGIPFSFLTTMILMYITDNSLNELTLFSFVLVTGIVVDDAIVVCENIYRHVQQDTPIQDAIVTGVSEVALPVIAATLTSIAAFLPMLVMSGSTGAFFELIPIAVTFALIGSLFECLFILPIHYLDFGPESPNQMAERLKHDNFIISFCRSLTHRILSFTLRYRWQSILGLFSLLAISLIILGLSISGTLPLIKIKFFPDDYSIYYVDIKGPSEAPTEQVDQMVRKISRYIADLGPGFSESAAGFAGFYVNEDYEPVYGNNYGNVMVTLPEKNQRQFTDPQDYLKQIRTELKKKFQNQDYSLAVHAQKDGPPTGKDINVRIVGSSLHSVVDLSENIYRFIQNNQNIAPYLTDIENDRGEPKRIYRFDIQHNRVHEFDLQSSRAAKLAGSLLDGRYIGKYRLEDDEIDIKVLIDPDTIDTPQDALSIPFIEHDTGPIRLGDIATLRTYKESGELHRYKGNRSITIKANLNPDATTSVASVTKMINDHYQQNRDQYPGATVIFGGEHEDTQRSYTSLTYAFIIAVMIMYVILSAQFQSYLQPMIILSSIIFALIGVVFGKFITQSVFTVNSFIAVIGVAGIVVNDTLILIDAMNNQLKEYGNHRLAIKNAIDMRLRPIILTTLTTTMGLLPMALGIPDYSVTWGSMASTFVTGLTTATFLTLFIVPVFWELIHEIKISSIISLK